MRKLLKAGLVPDLHGEEILAGKPLLIPARLDECKYSRVLDAAQKLRRGHASSRIDLVGPDDMLPPVPPAVARLPHSPVRQQVIGLIPRRLRPGLGE